jgi:hypothetical protein
MSTVQNFGAISTRSVKKFCEATRKDKAFLATAIKEIRSDVAGFAKKRFKLTREQIENLEAKFDQPETTELFALTLIRALKLNRTSPSGLSKPHRGKSLISRCRGKNVNPIPTPASPNSKIAAEFVWNGNAEGL